VQKKVKNIWWDTQSVLLLRRINHTNSSTTMKKYMYPETKFYAVVMQALMGTSTGPNYTETEGGGNQTDNTKPFD